MCQKLRLLRNAPAYANEWLDQGQATVFLHYTSRPRHFSHIGNDKITMRPMSNPHIHGSRADLSRMLQVSSSNGVFLMISFVLCMLLREYNTWTGFLVTRVFGWRLLKHSVYLISLTTNTAGTRYSVNGIYLAWRFYFGFPEGLFCIHWRAQQTKCCVINRLVTQ